MKDIYLLYACDEWKSNSSMSLRMATTSITKLKKEIELAVEDGDMDFSQSDVKGFLKETNSVSDIDTALGYGYIDAVTDGQRQ